MQFTAEECDRILAGFSFERDDRNPPDALRLGRFRQGWRDAAVKNKKYTTLHRLAWQNLGFRLGEMFGDAPDAEIEQVYESFKAHYEQRGRLSR